MFLASATCLSNERKAIIVFFPPSCYILKVLEGTTFCLHHNLFHESPLQNKPSQYPPLLISYLAQHGKQVLLCLPLPVSLPRWAVHFTNTGTLTTVYLGNQQRETFVKKFLTSEGGVGFIWRATFQSLDFLACFLIQKRKQLLYLQGKNEMVHKKCFR